MDLFLSNPLFCKICRIRSVAGIVHLFTPRGGPIKNGADHRLDLRLNAIPKGIFLCFLVLWVSGCSGALSDQLSLARAHRVRFRQVALTALTCATGSMSAAGTDNCTLTLNTAATGSGLTVSVASDNSSVAVPASVTVAAGASSASFAATVSTVSASQTATLSASAGTVTETFALQLGSSAPTLNVNASTVTFGNVNLNSPTTQSVTLSSTGSAPLSVTSISVSGAGFAESGVNFPLTLNPNQTATLSVTFDPTVTGSASGELTIASNSSTGSSTVVPMTGTGLTGTGQSTAYSVNLTWSAPGSSTDSVAGYNVLRSPSGASSYAQVNSSVVTQAAYTDNTVQDGQAYDYEVESVDASGVESAPSNIASFTIP